jgi:hypothetical protein
MHSNLVHFITENNIKELNRSFGPVGPLLKSIGSDSTREEDWIVRLQNTRNGVCVEARPKRGGQWTRLASQMPKDIVKLTRAIQDKSGNLMSRISWSDWCSGKWTGFQTSLQKKVKQALMLFVRITRRIKVVTHQTIQATLNIGFSQTMKISINPKTSSLEDKLKFISLCLTPPRLDLKN